MRILKIALLVVFAASTLLGTAGSASASTGCTPAGTFQDDNPNGFSPHIDFNYGPGWTQLSDYGGFGPPPHEPTNRTTSFTNTRFTGFLHSPRPYSPGTVDFRITCRSSFELVYGQAYNRGIADIYAYTPSGWKFAASVDQYSPVIQWRSSRIVPLPSGTISVLIINSGRKHPAATDIYIDIDGIIPR